jgi:peroxiredoxin
MQRVHSALFVMVLTALTLPNTAAPLPAAVAEDAPGPLAFCLRTVAGDEFQLGHSAGQQLTVVCFLGTECPLARLYAPRLQQLADHFAPQSVRFVGIYSNQQDSAEEIRRFAEEFDLGFPLIKDDDNQIADRYAASRTPQVFVVDGDLVIRYQGRIDDQYLPGVARSTAERHELREVLTKWVAGEPLEVAATEAVGCLIGRVKRPRPDSDVTYCDQIVRILHRQCVECHRTGEIGPFALTEYDEVVGWSDMILEVVNDGRMPPWHASHEHGEFKNARRLTDEEKRTLASWVTSGAPYGDEAQLPEPPEFVRGWQLPREPDRVIAMRDRPFVVPAVGTVEYQYFVVDPGFTEDRWVTAAQVIPGNSAVVHHSIVFIRPPDGGRFRGVGWLGAYVPGQRAFVLPPGRARFVPAGSKLVFQQHYTPNGTAQQDLTQVGLLFGESDEITHEMFTLVGIDQEFEIPPHDPAFSVQAQVSGVPKQGELLAIMPHMHLRGKSFHCWITDGQDKQVILDVPRYDFNWQHVYQLANPLALSHAKSLKFSATFDNSDSNPFNPDASQHVTWGDQTWEEMAVAFFEVAQPRSTEESEPEDRDDDDFDVVFDVDVAATKVQHEIDRIVMDFFARFDENEDGVVERAETPISFRHFGFARFDDDGDQRLTREEIGRAASERVR